MQYQQIEYLFHITHKENVPGILTAGALLCHARAHREQCPTDISDPEVQERRAKKIDPIHGCPLHTYVPLYFRARNPMLYVRQSQQDNMVVLYVDRGLLRKRGVIFTDGNAASDATRFFSDVSDLSKLDWECLGAQRWKDYEDGKRKRCAEVLVPNEVPLARVTRAVVRNDAVRSELS